MIKPNFVHDNAQRKLRQHEFCRGKRALKYSIDDLLFKQSLTSKISITKNMLFSDLNFAPV